MHRAADGSVEPAARELTVRVDRSLGIRDDDLVELEAFRESQGKDDHARARQALALAQRLHRAAELLAQPVGARLVCGDDGREEVLAPPSCLVGLC